MKMNHFLDFVRRHVQLRCPQRDSDFTLPARKDRFQRLPDVAAIDGAERFRLLVSALRHQDIGVGGLGSVQQGLQETGVQFRHVASGHQVEVGGGVGQSCQDAAQRSFSGIQVRDCGIAGGPTNLWCADQDDAARRLFHCPGDGLDQRTAAKRQRGFVSAHAGTGAPRQHVPSPVHREMITLEFFLPNPNGLAYTKEQNILFRSCFRLTAVGLLAVSLWGGEGGARVTSVVRSDARTGKLVRSVVVSGRVVPRRVVAEAVVSPADANNPASPAAEITAPVGVPELVARIAAQNSLPPELVHSVIQVESNYNPYAVSPKGALGLMQLIPATARRFGVADVFNPEDNIQGGARYLKYLLDLFGDYPLALAAYNAGEGAVARYGNIPPYRETERYVKLVGKHVEDAHKAAAAHAKPLPEVKPAPVPSDGVSHIQAVVEADGSLRYVSR